MQFKVLRYALVPFQQADLLERELPNPKGKVIEQAVPPNAAPRIFTYRNRQFAFVGFSYVVGFEEERFLVGRLAKKKTIGIGELRDRDIVGITTDDWIPIWLAIDTHQQYMAVEMNARFGGLDHVIQVIQTGLSEPVQVAYRNEVVVSPVTDARRFWDVVREADRIYRLTLEFVSPNFLNTPKRVREVLHDWQEIFNQTEAEIELKNEEGQLRVPEDDLAEPIEYISEGEGNWSLEVAREGEAAKHVYSSKDGTETLRLEVPRASRPEQELAAAPEKERTIVGRLLELIRGRHAA